MEHVYSLIQCLTPAEWESFQKYLTCFSSHDGINLRQLRLAVILREAKTIPSEETCRMKANYSKSEISFDMLKSWLKEKVLDFLSTDVCNKKLELDEADVMSIKMKKKSAQFQHLFYSKKRMALLPCLLDDIIKEAKEYEQYAILIEHLKAKKNIVSWKQGKTEFEKTNQEMEDAAKRLALYNKAEHYYYELGLMLQYEGRQNNKKKLSFLQKAIAEIEAENTDIKSPHVNYSLKFLEIEYCQLKNDYEGARSRCLEWLDIVRNNKSVYRRQRIGVVYDNLSRCEYYLGRYRQAADWAMEAQKHFNLNSENYCIALEQEFYALLAMGENYNAIETANKMIASATRKELGEFRYSKYNYLLANALFKERKFEGALHLLSQEQELSKDKAGWETGARTLKIMTLIEILKLDEASLAVNSLKQFFTYTEKNGTPINPRDKKILNLLLLAERKGFTFTLLNGNTDKYFSALTEDEKNRWEPFTHEVIPFHEWFAGKMGRRKAVHSVAAKGRKKEKKVEV